MSGEHDHAPISTDQIVKHLQACIAGDQLDAAIFIYPQIDPRDRLRPDVRAVAAEIERMRVARRRGLTG